MSSAQRAAALFVLFPKRALSREKQITCFPRFVHDDLSRAVSYPRIWHGLCEQATESNFGIKVVRLALLVNIIFLISPYIHAQGSTSVLGGKVFDPVGNVIPD